MDALGLSLIVGGLALLVSGLIVLLQTRRNTSAQRQDAEQTINEIDDRLRETRREQGDTS